MGPLIIQIGLRDSKVNEIKLVHLLLLIFVVSNHDVVRFDVTMDKPFAMHGLN